MHTYRDFLTTTLTAAAKIAVANFGNLSHSVKAGDRNQVLTETDLEIGYFLTDAIRTTYPDHNIIDEELGCADNGSRYTWVVDPIDGTSNFAVGLPQYGIMLGAARSRHPSGWWHSPACLWRALRCDQGRGCLV